MHDHSLGLQVSPRPAPGPAPPPRPFLLGPKTAGASSSRLRPSSQSHDLSARKCATACPVLYSGWRRARFSVVRVYIRRGLLQGIGGGLRLDLVGSPSSIFPRANYTCQYSATARPATTQDPVISSSIRCHRCVPTPTARSPACLGFVCGCGGARARAFPRRLATPPGGTGRRCSASSFADAAAPSSQVDKHGTMRSVRHLHLS
jgi:hypothetical protein